MRAVVAEGARAGRFEELPKRPAKLEARVEGFSLEAGRHVHVNDREGPERLCKYGARPPLSVDRLSRASDGQLLLRFKRPLADGQPGALRTDRTATSGRLSMFAELLMGGREEIQLQDSLACELLLIYSGGPGGIALCTESVGCFLQLL